MSKAAEESSSSLAFQNLHRPKWTEQELPTSKIDRTSTKQDHNYELVNTQLLSLPSIAGFHMTSLKFKLQNYWSSWYLTLMRYKSSWKLICRRIFVPKWVLGFAIHYAWISKLLRDAAFTWRPSCLKSDLFRDWFRDIWLSERFLVLGKVLF